MLGGEMLPLLPDMLRTVLHRAAAPLRVWWRSNWLYRRLLRGPLADHIVFHPWDGAPRQLEEADACEGTFSPRLSPRRSRGPFSTAP
jgi:hypothetical protein